MTAAHLTVEETRTAQDAVLVLTGEIDMATVGETRTASERQNETTTARSGRDFRGAHDGAALVDPQRERHVRDTELVDHGEGFVDH